MSSKDNYFRLLCLTFETATFILRQLMEQYLNRTKISLIQLIDKHQHEIFHFYSDKKCCLCSKNPVTSKPVIRREQILKLFDTARRLPGHSNQKTDRLCCCYGQQNISVRTLDFTLLRFLMINFCEDEFWESFLKVYTNFEDFLNREKHTMFHLWQPNIPCCECRPGYSAPEDNFLSKQRFRIMYRHLSKTKGSCSQDDTCHYEAERGLTYLDIKKRDRTLFNSITNYFCSIRKAIETIAKIRNEKLAHVEIIEVSNSEYEDAWHSLETSIIEIATSTNCMVEARQRIENHKCKDLDMNMCAKWRNKLLYEIAVSQDQKQQIQELKSDTDLDHQVLDAKIDTLQESFFSHAGLLMEINKNTNLLCEKFKADCLDTVLLSNNVDRQHSNHHISDNIDIHQLPKTLLDDVSAIVKQHEVDLQDYSDTSITNTKIKIEENADIAVEKEVEDKHICGSCDETFYSLDKFVHHKAVCKSTAKPCPKQLSSENSEFVQVRMRFDRDDPSWERVVERRERLVNVKTTTTQGPNLDFIEKGSLVLWTKMHKAAVTNKQLFVKNVDEFVFNMISKCPIETDEETKLTIKIDVLRDYAGDEGDRFVCGKCKSEFYAIEQFCSHKRQCSAKSRPIMSNTATKSTFENVTTAFQELPNQNMDIPSLQGAQKIALEDPLSVSDKEVHMEKIKDPSLEDLCNDKQSGDSRGKRLHRISNEISLSLFPDEIKAYESKLYNIESAEKGIGVIRKLRKRKKKKFVPVSTLDTKEEYHESDCDLATSSWDDVDKDYIDNDNISDNSVQDDGFSSLKNTEYSFKPCSGEALTDEAQKRITSSENSTISQSLYEQSKKSRPVSSFNDVDLIKYGLRLSSACVTEMSSKVRKSNKDYYEDFILDKENLQRLYKTEPVKYKRGMLEIEASHSAKCIITDVLETDSIIEISGRSKCGKAFTEDEVVVEILGKETERERQIRMNKQILKGKTFGKVIGVLKRNRCLNIDFPVFICEIDEHEMGKAKPLCKTVPKLQLVREGDAKPYTVDVYCYMEDDKTLKFDKEMTINKHLIKSYLFYVVCLSWDKLQYPIGAVFKVHESTENYVSTMKILDLQYNVPFLFGDRASNAVEVTKKAFNDMIVQNKHHEGRRDLKHLLVFTIDPEKSTVFDDAISIQYIPGNEYEVGIHITDVASIIQQDSALDIEARHRGTTYFPGQFLNPRHMLPEPISEEICSLMPGEERLAMTIFLYFDSSKQIEFGKTKFCKSVIKSHKRVSYKEVQKMIDDPKYEHQLQNQIRDLYAISRVSRKQRLGNSAYAVPVELDLPGEGDSNSFEAYCLIEEFMVLTNYLVAVFLQGHFPHCIPVRCQNSPPVEAVHKWLQSYPIISDIIFELQGKHPLPQRRITIANVEAKIRPIDIIPVQSSIWKSFKLSVSNQNFKKARDLLLSDELHPLQGLALSEWQKFQQIATYKCSGNVSRKEDLAHFALGLYPYVHFTAPIRRYIDIVIQRLLHAMLDKGSAPYSKEEICKICTYFNNISNNARIYRMKCLELVLACSLVKIPLMTRGFVADFSETEIYLVIPGMNFVQSQSKTILISNLNISSVPETVIDNDFLRMNRDSEKTILVLKWKKRIYSVTEKPPRAKTPSKGYERSENEYQRIDPHQHSHYQLTSKWIEHLKLLTSGASSSQIATELQVEKFNRQTNRYLQSTFSTELDINCELNQVKSEEGTRVMFQETFCKFSFTFSHGQVLPVQFSWEMRNGLLTPALDFIYLTKNIKFCIKHMRDPISCLESYSTRRSADKYEASQEYKDLWIPIILMESSFCVVKGNGIIINDVNIRFEKKNGFFTLYAGFCFERHIDFGYLTSKFLEQDPVRSESSQFTNGVSDYLCIRCKLPYEETERCFGQKIQNESYFWIAHAKINRILKVERGTPNERLRVYFNIVNDGIVPEKIRYKERGVGCSIEILPRVESDKRMEVTLDYLNRADILAKSIALNKPIPELDQKYVKVVKKCDIEIGLPQNNPMQNKAIKIALKSSFCLIHGPPGTGKTNTAIKLVHLFHEINRLRQQDDGGERNKIVFCGSSNKSVDLVARRLRKYAIKDGPSIVRFYGTTIERSATGIPGALINSQTGTTDPDMQDIAVHMLIRKSGTYATDICRLENDFRMNPSKMSPDKVKEHTKLIKSATIDVLSKHDVIFCTTSMATSPRLIEAVRNNVYQLIIDECGMCTEPECISAIIATRAKQVVLIGDHKQLRPIVMCRQAAELGLDTSLFERYCKTKTAPIVQLNMQYRMHESICKFPSDQFYDGSLKTAESQSYVENPRLSIWLNDHGLHRVERHIFCHVEGTEECVQVSTDAENERSFSNVSEVEQAVKIFHYLRDVEKIFSRDLTLNIMSQYNAQCSALKMAIPEDKRKNADIQTVVSSQGGEWDYVIFSLVRSLPDYRIEPHPTKGWCKENLGFITDHNQITVALTRAKKGLFLIGNKNLLSCEKKWKLLIEEYNAKGCVVEATKFPKPQVRSSSSRTRQYRKR